MLGQMMKMPLLISSLISHAENRHGATEIASVETTGGITHTNWKTVGQNSRRLASALGKLGLAEGDRVGTIAWNNYRHLEIYFGVSGGGYVCHTINPRLFPEQLVYVINHAEDKVLCFDKTFLPIAVKLREHLKTVKTFVLMSGRDEEAASQLPGVVFYDELIATGDANYTWPVLNEDAASSLCYTSGTTGNPKGVLYSHRSTLLHTFAVCLPDCLNISAIESVLPVVPMFHVNAWGIPYATAMVGAKLVMPGPGLDGPSLVKLIDGEQVTVALGVPTIWQGLLAAAAKMGSKLDSLKRTVVGGSACPPSMMKTFRESYGVDTVHAWGMTELSPLGSANNLLRKHLNLSPEEQARVRESQGRPPFGIELKVVSEEDHQGQGDLLVRGHWVVDKYFRETTSPLQDGWFPTGDVSTIDDDGYMTIRDRSKDIIKSGGEWISTVELENIAVGHPGLADAAVIAARHEKWDERPLLIVVRKEGETPSSDDITHFFDDKIAKWQTPDAVVFVDAIPRNATGKVLKNKLREEFSEYLINKKD